VEDTLRYVTLQVEFAQRTHRECRQYSSMPVKNTLWWRNEGNHAEHRDAWLCWVQDSIIHRLFSVGCEL